MECATQWKPTLLPVQGGQRNGRATSPRAVWRGSPPPTPRAPPHSPHNRWALPDPEGEMRSEPPPHTPPGRQTAPDTQAHLCAGKRPGTRQGDAGPGHPPTDTLDGRSTGPGQETRRGTNHLERPYRRPARVPREVRAFGQQGGRARTPRVRDRTHTQRARGANLKGNWTEPAERKDRLEWRTSKRSKWTPGRDNGQHAPRGARGKGETSGGDRRTATGPAPPDLPRAPRTHEQGTAPAKAVVAHSATHQPRG